MFVKHHYGKKGNVMTTWIYNSITYNTEAEVNAAVTALKSRLDNNPTDWVVVKEVTSNGNGGWTVPSETLTDAEINSMSNDSYYNVNAVHSGATYTGITGTEANTRVAELRTDYAQWVEANTILKNYAPTNEDMSGYV